MSQRIHADSAMTRAEWEAIAEDSAKKAAHARELLRLKTKEEDELRAKAIAAQPTPLKSMAQAAPESLIARHCDDAFGALANQGSGLRARLGSAGKICRFF